MAEKQYADKEFMQEYSSYLKEKVLDPIRSIKDSLHVTYLDTSEPDPYLVLTSEDETKSVQIMTNGNYGGNQSGGGMGIRFRSNDGNGTAAQNYGNIALKAVPDHGWDYVLTLPNETGTLATRNYADDAVDTLVSELQGGGYLLGDSIRLTNAGIKNKPMVTFAIGNIGSVSNTPYFLWKPAGTSNVALSAVLPSDRVGTSSLTNPMVLASREWVEGKVPTQQIGYIRDIATSAQDEYNLYDIPEEATGVEADIWFYRGNTVSSYLYIGFGTTNSTYPHATLMTIQHSDINESSGNLNTAPHLKMFMSREPGSATAKYMIMDMGSGTSVPTMGTSSYLIDKIVCDKPRNAKIFGFVRIYLKGDMAPQLPQVVS